MNPLVQSILRITLAVASICALLAIAIAALVRQPTLQRVAFDGTTRASADALRNHVRYLTIDVRPRSVEALDNLDQAAAYIHAAFSTSGGEVSYQEFVARGRRYRNVVARFGSGTGSPLVVGAHYDAFSSTGNLPGADDNASGTAALLEIARLLGTKPPASPVELVAFTTEEPPFYGSDEMGSAIHAKELSGSGVRPGVMICLEMIGYFDGDQSWPSPLLGALYPDTGSFIAVAGGWRDRRLARHVKAAIRGAGGVSVYSFTGPRAMLDGSDQRNYWARGWDAVLVTDTAYLRNPNYHTARDTHDTLDYNRMARVVDGVFSAVLAWDG